MADLFDTPLFRPRAAPTVEAGPVTPPVRRAARAAPVKARPARPAPTVTDLPWRITTPAGEVAVIVEAAREAGASIIRLEGEVGWAENTAVTEIVPTGERWVVEVGA